MSFREEVMVNNHLYYKYIPDEVLNNIFNLIDINSRLSICKYKRSLYLKTYRSVMIVHNKQIYDTNYISDFDVILYMINIEEIKKYKYVLSFTKNNLLYPISTIFINPFVVIDVQQFNERLKCIRRNEKNKCDNLYFNKLYTLTRIRKRRELLNSLDDINVIFWKICQQYINDYNTEYTISTIVSYVNNRLKNKTYTEICIINMEELRMIEHYNNHIIKKN